MSPTPSILHPPDLVSRMSSPNSSTSDESDGSSSDTESTSEESEDESAESSKDAPPKVQDNMHIIIKYVRITIEPIKFETLYSVHFHSETLEIQESIEEGCKDIASQGRTAVI